MARVSRGLAAHPWASGGIPYLWGIYREAPKAMKWRRLSDEYPCKRGSKGDISCDPH